MYTQTIETHDSDSYSDGTINIDIDIDIDPGIGDNGDAVAAAAIGAIDAAAMHDAPKTPQKRPRDDDFDVSLTTSRGLQPPPAQGSFDAPDTSDSLSLCSRSADDASNASSASNRSGRNSLRKS